MARSSETSEYRGPDYSTGKHLTGLRLGPLSIVRTSYVHWLERQTEPDMNVNLSGETPPELSPVIDSSAEQPLSDSQPHF